MKIRTGALVAVLSCVALSAHAEIYRWVDANGKVHYTDKPPAGVKVEKREYSNVSTPFRATPKDIYLKDEEPEEPPQAPDAETVQKPEVPPKPPVDESLLSDEEKAELAAQEKERLKKLKEESKKAEKEYKKARKALREKDK